MRSGRLSEFSRRSKRSWQAQWQCEDDLSRLAAWIRVAEENIKRLTKSVEDTKRHMVETGNVTPQYLGDMTRDLENEKVRLGVLKEEESRLRKRIRELELPSREQATLRRDQQIRIARLCDERLEGDRVIASVVTQLRELLERRADLTERMREAASAIELSADLDERRFEPLLAALPEGGGQASEGWHRRFIGAERGRKRCIVQAHRIELEETLASSGCYPEGDKVSLTPEQAAPLLAAHQIADEAEAPAARATARRASNPPTAA